MIRIGYSAAIGVLVVFTAVPASLAGTNLLTNPDFGSGTTGWSRSNTDITIVHRTDSGSMLPGGSGPPCLEVRNVGGSYSFSGGGQSITVTVGRQYVFSASAFLPRADNLADRVGAVVSFWSASSFISSVSLNTSPTPYGTWQRFEGAIVAPPGAVSAYFNLCVRNPSNTTTVTPAVALFDDAYAAEMATEGQEVHELFLPVASSKGGLGGTFWTTTLWLANLGATPTVIKGAVLVPSQDNTAAVAGASNIVTLDGGASTLRSDIVARLGVSNVTGAVYLRAETPATETARDLIAAASRNSTPNPGGSGAYGQAVTGVRAGERAVATATGITVGDAFRTNIGVLNTSGQTISVAVEVRRDDRVPVASATWTLHPYEPRMVNATSLGITSLGSGTVIFSLASPTGSFRGFLSVVDNGSNDSIYIPAS